MTRDALKFPPPGLTDLGREAAGYVIALVKNSRTSPITIAVGAGVSVSAGFPTWTELLQRIVSTYFCHWEFQVQTRRTASRLPPSNLSISFWESAFWSPRAQESSSNLLNMYGPLRAAQMVKQHVRPADWSYLVRKSLYGHHTQRTSELVTAIATTCAADPTIEVLSYNYDNLIESALRNLGCFPNPIYDSNQSAKSSHTTIVHPHGYLDERGGPSIELVLGEDDYHRYAGNQTGWHNTVQTRAFLRSTCLFIGSSDDRSTDEQAPVASEANWRGQALRSLTIIVFRPREPPAT